MKEDRVHNLLQTYFAKVKEGGEPYFDPDEVEAILDRFEEQEDFQNYGDIVKLGLRLHPDNSTLKIRLCRYYLLNERFQEALELAEAIPIPHGADIDLTRVECYCVLRQYERAKNYIDLLIKMKCDYIEDIFEIVSQLLNDMNRCDDAAPFIWRGLELFPDNTVLKEEFCYFLENKGLYEEAIRIYNELLDKDPYSKENWFNLGRLYSLNSAYDKALEAFDYSETCSGELETSEKEDILILRIFCYFMNENYDKVLDVYSILLAEHGNAINEHVEMLLADCYVKLDEFEEALKILSGVIEKGNCSALAYMNYIRCCLETDRRGEAERIISVAADLFPNNIRMLTLLALLKADNEDSPSSTELSAIVARYMEEEESAGEDLMPTARFTAEQNPVPAANLIQALINNPLSMN